MFPSARIGVVGSYIDVQLDQRKTEEHGLKEALASSPVLLLFDELQLAAKTALIEENPNLNWLRTGSHGPAMFPVFAGPANSGDLLRDAGLTWLSSDCEFTLSRFSDAISEKLFPRLAGACLTSAKPSAGTVELWKSVMLPD